MNNLIANIVLLTSFIGGLGVVFAVLISFVEKIIIAFKKKEIKLTEKDLKNFEKIRENSIEGWVSSVISKQTGNPDSWKHATFNIKNKTVKWW